MVTAPSNLWGRVCKCVFLSSDLQIVPFIAFVTVKIKVPGWPTPQITESAQGAAAGWEHGGVWPPLQGVHICAHSDTLPRVIGTCTQEQKDVLLVLSFVAAGSLCSSV
jgi:hypothetical protein